MCAPLGDMSTAGWCKERSPSDAQVLPGLPGATQSSRDPGVNSVPLPPGSPGPLKAPNHPLHLLESL